MKAVAIALGNSPKPKSGKRTVRRQHRGGTRWGKILFLVVLLYFGYSSLGQVKLMIALRQELAQVEQAIASAEQRTDEIKAEITYLKSDSYVEKVARQELGLVKPGEIIFMPESSPEAH
ncbi:MAG: septum formation initiator family protein [Firmicutes bacterium]|nr:septum formation initiator family protein [Bacillota bacterium]